MRPHISTFSTYLIDLDGVIYRGETLVPGACEFVHWLHTNQKKHLFLTNNSFASELQVVNKLTRLGIVTDSAHVMGAGQAAVEAVAHRYPRAHVLVIGEEPLIEQVRAQQLLLANDVPDSLIDVVLVGLDRTFDYTKLTRAVLAVRAGAIFIGINRDPLLPVAGGFLAGTGSLVAAIEAGSGQTPEIIGKPQPTLFQEAMRKLESTPEETVMIGDGLESDILGGKAAGTQTAFVLSGRDTRASLDQKGILPDYVYEDLAEVVSEIHVYQHQHL